MNILVLFLIGISLSMDTFSLALSLGTFNISKKRILLFVIFVGIFHFIMPILGFLIKASLPFLLNINSNKLLFVIFSLIAVEMGLDIFSDNNKQLKLTLFSSILYAFSVSIDSFTIGVGLSSLSLGPIIFSSCAMAFTILGYYIGKYSYKKIGIYAKIIGLIIMIGLAILHLFI